ncbi:MAG: two component transcriptional regulator, winged helix family [Ilumatobacteraceae bacterium]|nr:two component transcriptional regulator, winged helix family [Ilumatobacteraceae bacterium]MCU1388917.1 two component transcriptional regulator, winged helix family [Ilumatobacteraceae bacterium]
MRVLVVEDEPKMADVLRRALQRDGYAVDVAGDGSEALWFAGSVAFDAIVLDAMIPAPDGFEVCRRLRATECWVPILMLTARDAVADRVAGLDAGADDYLTKPFSLVELLARLRAITRREPAVRPVVLTVGGLRLDPATHQVTRDGVVIDLSPKEFALLQHFMRHPGEALSRSDIIEHVWDFAYDGTSNVVDVYVHYLRDRIDRPFGTSDLQTVVGVGYRLAAPVTA